MRESVCVTVDCQDRDRCVAELGLYERTVSNRPFRQSISAPSSGAPGSAQAYSLCVTGTLAIGDVPLPEVGLQTMNSTRTALITGASRGLGLALARELAGRGWSLILDARGAAALEATRAELGSRTQVRALPGDVADPAHRQELSAAALAAGGLDLVVNNASILGPSPQPNLLDYPLEVLEQVYRVNVVAPLGLLQALRTALKPGARIVNITSDAAVEPYPGWGGYGSSKAGLEQLSAILAAENPGLLVYWVDPGDMRTQMQQEAFPGEDISDRPEPETSVPGLMELIDGTLPSGRYVARALVAEVPG